MFEPVRSRPKARRFWGPAIGVAAAIVTVTFGLGVLVTNAERAAEARRAADAAQMRIALAEIKSTLDSGLAAGQHDAVVDVRPKSTGVAGRLEGAFKRFVAQILDDRRSYKRELSELGFPGFLAAPRLARENLNQVLAKLGQARTVERKYQSLGEQRILQFRNIADNAGLTGQEKADFIAGYDGAFSQSQAANEQAWSYEDGLLSAYQQLIALLHNQRSGWTFNGRQLVFANRSLLSAYNERVTAIKLLAASELAARDQARQSVDRKADDLMTQIN